MPPTTPSHRGAEDQREARPAPSVTFSTREVACADRLDYWSDLYRAFADVEIDAAVRADFQARSETWRVGPFVMTEAEGPGLRFRRTAAHCAMADGDFWVFRVAADTAWTSCDGDSAERIGPGELFLRRTDRPTLTAAPKGRTRLLLLPCDADPELDAALSQARQGRVAGGGAALLADMLAALPARLRATPEDGLAPLADRLRDVIRACLPGDPPAADLQRAMGGRRARGRVIAVIRAHIGSALLDVDRIARLAGVSRSTLYRMFEDEGGVARFVRDLRLRLVMEDLGRPDLMAVPIAEIAERRGLHSAASFSRAFRRAYGCTPRDARAAALAGAGQAAPAGGGAPRDPLGRL